MLPRFSWLRLLLLLAELLRLELRLLPLLLRRLERLSLQRLELQVHLLRLRGMLRLLVPRLGLPGCCCNSCSCGCAGETPRWFPHVARRRCWPARRMTDDGSR